MSNFSFLATEWPELREPATKAESFVYTDVRSCCFYARRALELAVEWLYKNDSDLKRPYDNNLSALIYEPTFKNNLTNDLFLKVRTIKEIGNIAVHSNKPITENDGLRTTKELFHFLYWLARMYTLKDPKHYQGINFDEKKIPARQATTSVKSIEQLRKLEEQLKQKDEQLAEKTKAIADTDAEIAQLRKEIAEAKKQNQLIPDDHDYSEAETRDYFIDLMLKEAGWPLDKPEDREYKIVGMPNNSGKGSIDYVLWGNDGKPLAVVEAKRTRKDARIGQQQAKLYADCLEQQFNQRPLIFYTNGYQTWFWDDLNYPPRNVQGFYKKDELELVIQRRSIRKDIKQEKVNENIVERYYQKGAIHSITDQLSNFQRKALIVMATGAGKTRTVVALCELLQRCNLAKRILFLADRVALVKQAVNAFKKYLPDSNPVNLVTEKDEVNSRVYVSTYPTMLKMISEVENGTRSFGVGHFDLVIIDEAHRSVYQKYKAIFEYFDSLLIGLTATPKDEVDRNTYSLFELEKGVPTYAYELEQAVADGFLVPSRPVEVPLKFLREGIKYDELSEEEKEEWEAQEWDESGNIPDKVDAGALNKWLFNIDTVDKVLQTLMTRGLKVAGGDVLGKTIIFAKSHQHAVFIQERFDKNYPNYKGNFARVIDNYEPYAETLLEEFSTHNKYPQIAISVDMLDTGIDIPEVVNLVFFKVVHSKTKFFQMIGRGTRLRPDLFAPGKKKEFFYIFDYCQNLEYFRQNSKGTQSSTQEPLNKKLFKKRLELIESVRKLESSDETLIDLTHSLTSRLQKEVAAMNLENFIVRPHREHIEKYKEEPAWENLKEEDYSEIANILAGLPSELESENEIAKRFDLLILRIQLAILQSDKTFPSLSKQVKEIANRLEDKASIPMVKDQLDLIRDLQQDEYWADITLPMLEQIRQKMRDLVKFIDKEQRKIIYTDFEDELGEIVESSLDGLITVTDLAQYKKKMLHFLREHENHIAIHKLKYNVPITSTDIVELEKILFESGEIGTREDFEKTYGKQESLGLFIRSLVGLDREAAKQCFNEFLNDKLFNANQIQFIDHIINYLTQNGVMDAKLLYTPPFTDSSPSGLDGIFQDKEADRIVSLLDEIQKNAAA